MSTNPIIRRFVTAGVFWRQLIAWAVVNVTPWLEPPLLWLWSLFFFLGAQGNRRGILANLRVTAPHLGPFRRAWFGMRAFWKFALTFTDTTRFHEQRIELDWEVSGTAHLDDLAAEQNGIVITAHMGNYDLGAFAFARKTGRPLVLVRAPETDPDSDSHARRQRERSLREIGTIAVQLSAENPVLDLLDALRNGSIVAIQGDRVVPGVADLQATMFGRTISIPAGPFALAMATGARLWPLFIVRMGRRHYRIMAFPPIEVRRTSRDRDADMRRAANAWLAILERVLCEFPDQWFAFYPAFGARAEDTPPEAPTPLPAPPAIPRAARWAPSRFRFALGRVIARLMGGHDDAIPDAVGRLSMARRPGQSWTENTFMATVANLLPALALWHWLPLPAPIAVPLAIIFPLVFWMVVIIGSSAFLYATKLARTNERIAPLQSRIAVSVMTVLAAWLIATGNLPIRAAGWLWMALLALNGVAAVLERTRR